MRRSLLLLACLASSASAQIVEIQLKERGTGTPIAGAVVRLLHEDTEMSQALTNASGKVAFRAPQYGVYKVRVNRIGFRSVTLDSIVVSGNETVRRELTMSTTPFVLPSIETQTKSACGPRLDDGATISLLWEQIATALRANVLTQTVWQLPLNVQRFKRNVTLKDSVVRDLIVGSFIVHGPPFAAADPVLLEKNGFVTEDREGTIFNAPDAATLLSDAFVSSHCFSAVPGRNGLMGLAFEPAPKRRLSDVKGTLWIDQASSELRSLDYVYTNLHNGMERVTLGGRVDFKRLETGAWIVSYWHIRMPKIHVIPADVHFYGGQQITRPEMRDVDYYIEEGGRVTVIDATTTIVTVATLIGTVRDSSANLAGLEGAVIHLAGEPDSAVTDSAGHYRLVTKSAGTHTATISHAKFGLISDSSTKEVYLSLGSSARTDFAVPSPTTFIREFCGRAENTSSGIVGRALSAKGEGLEGYDIRVTWAVGGPDGNMGEGKFLEEHAESGPNGIFVVCSLPPKQEFTLYLRRRGEQLGKMYLRLESGDYKWVDLKAAPPPPQ